MKQRLFLNLLALIAASSVALAELATLPADPYFAAFKPLAAPKPAGLQLQRGDRLAICGDSITEQKMYSRIMETYLTACVPELEVTARQFGWSGERAPGFLARLTNDVLRFHPTIATTCYGMNDHRYQPFIEEIGQEYRANSQAVLHAFKANGARVIQGSPGTVGKMPSWVTSAKGNINDLNLGLLELRNIGVQLAGEEQVGFADVFLPMLVEGFRAQKEFGPDYMISGKDGVHPGWAGQLVMACAFLKALGLDGNIGTITVDLAEGQATASAGHRVLEATKNEVQLESTRYPFCATGRTNDDGSIRSGMALVPFNEDLNRLTLVVRQATSPRYRVTWGDTSRTYSAAELERGVNLAADFPTNPFSAAFSRVDEAVAKKQAYETRQVKELFHGPEGKADMDATAALTEKARAPLAASIRRAMKPVKHTVRIDAE